MKFLSWNVNGLRACLQKGFLEFLKESNADTICLQETKMQPEQADFELPGYTRYWNSAFRKGYSGTAIFTKNSPISVQYDIDDSDHMGEGRSITLEYPEYYLVTVYTPNSQDELKRLPYRMEWEDAFRTYLMKLDQKKPVIVCGDMNVAHQEIDLKNPKSNRKNAGFSDEERGKFSELLEAGFLDSFRFFYPDKTGAYTWWSYMFKAREKNVGWRIDYFCVSKILEHQIKDALIHSDVMGSDHCPVELIIEEASFSPLAVVE
ncbi:MAG TPA: exodeoxyribonuclease III [Ruminiclostridium sp.]|nr:exodeoxyribonuclease III [Ruminiclostridium sp.]